MTPIAIRGFLNGVRVFEEFVDADKANLEQLGKKHALCLNDDRHMLEIEFLNEPDPNQRFFRFGTDPRGMVLPIKLNLSTEQPS